MPKSVPYPKVYRALSCSVPCSVPFLEAYLEGGAAAVEDAVHLSLVAPYASSVPHISTTIR
eukprot:3921510-Rhodomonas_salina.1